MIVSVIDFVMNLVVVIYVFVCGSVFYGIVIDVVCGWVLIVFEGMG